MNVRFILILITSLIFSVGSVYGQTTANNDTLTVIEDVTDTLDVLVNDISNGQLVIIEVIDVFFNTIGDVSLVDGDTLIRYVPFRDSEEPDTFLYVAGLSPQGAGEVLNLDTAMVIINIDPVNDSPVLVPVDDISVGEGSTEEINISATDIENDPIELTIANHPSFVTLEDGGNGTGIIRISPSFEDADEYNITVIASDADDPQIFTSDTFTLTVQETNRAPNIITTINDQEMTEGQLLNISIAAEDPDGHQIFWAIENLPDFASFNETTNTLRFQPDFEDAGIYEDITITVSDNGVPSLSDEVEFNLTVTNVNRPPLLTAIDDQEMMEGETLEIPVVVDDPDGNQVDLSFSNLPDFAEWDEDNNILSFLPDFEDAGVYENISITATDNGNPIDSAFTSFNLIVNDKNRAPQLEVILDQTIAEGDMEIITVSAMDPDGDSIDLFISNRPSFVQFTDNGDGSGEICFSPGYFADGNYRGIEITAYDVHPSSLSDEKSFDLTVTNTNRAPQLADIADRVMAIEDTLKIPLTFSDPDGDLLQIKVEGLPAFGEHSMAAFDSIYFWPTADNNGNYKDITVIVSDDIEGSLSDTAQFDLKVLQRPHITKFTSGESALYKQDLRVSVEIAADTTLQSVQLNYRKNGQQDYRLQTMTRQADGTYSATIEGSFVDECGLNYFVTIEDAYALKNNPDRKYLSTQIPVGTFVRNVAREKQWFMFSFPFASASTNIDAVLKSFGEESDARWRIYRTAPSGIGKESFGYEALKGMGEYGRFASGNAFWLYLHTVDSKSLKFPAMETLRGDTVVTIELQPGWNQIGSPFSFNISWQQVVQENGSEAVNIYHFQENSNRSGFSDNLWGSNAEMIPWEGYAVFNPNEAAVILSFHSQGVMPTEPTLSKSSVSDDWRLKLYAANQKSFAQATIGMAADAALRKDRHDYIAPPIFGDHYTALMFDHSDWSERAGKYAGDIRPLDPRGAAWPLTILSSSRIVHYRVDNLIDLPENFSALLYDRKYNRSYELLPNTEIELTDIRNDEKDRFLLMVGTAVFLQEELADVEALLPAAFRLFQNYPNPFNPETLITYRVPKKSVVRIDVMNVLGQHITTLVDRAHTPGTHEIRWDGRDGSGRATASGVYFYRLQTSGFVQTLKMLKIQ